MKNVNKVKYLGDVINNLGNVNDTVNDRYSRGIGIINQITSLLTTILLGIYYYDIAMVLRESMLINSILTSSQSWYNVSNKHLETLESIDILYMRKIFNSHSKTAREIYFLETGKLQIKYVLSKRRLMYLHHILTRDKNELIYKVYKTQELKITKGDWFSMIQSQKKLYNIQLTDNQISVMKNNLLKNELNKMLKT